MTGLTFKEFYDALNFGADIDIKCEHFYYHISTGFDDKQEHSISVYKYDKHPDSNEAFTVYDEIYYSSNPNPKDNIDRFLRFQIFDNKSFYDVCDSLEVLYS